MLILDEPTNDLDTDMLAAIEDLLDSWPGTLIVVSHDRYFLERVTDQQYAILDHKLRHLPGGVDEYLRLRAEQQRASVASGRPPVHTTHTDAGLAVTVHHAPMLSGAERRAAEKELAAAERRIEKLHEEVSQAREALAEFDQTDYQLLNLEMMKISALETEVEALEHRWLELSELLA